MRRSFTLFSIVVHTIVIAGGLYAQIVADVALPTLHRPIIFDSSSFMPVEIQLPTPPVAPAVKASETVSPGAAPVVAPAGVREETGHEGDPAPTHGTVIAGVESGPPSAIDGLGIGGIAAPPPPPPQPAPPMHLHSGMKAPLKTVDVAPVYPPIARNARVQGVVILEAVLDVQGRVQSVRVLRSIPLLDQAAVEAVQQWRFTPALLNGEAVPVVMTVTVNFTLQ
jgi:periplasmic protein TonB